MEEWERSHFATTNEDLELAEAIRAVERVAESAHIKGSTRVSLRLALQALRADRD
jgi:hypothetical protein